jgi:MFS transporter, ACDE family, multidrug resistance protein
MHPLDFAGGRARAMLACGGVRGRMGETNARWKIAAETTAPGMSAYAPADTAIVHATARRTTLTFLSLFIVPSVAQSVLLTVVPLEALRLLGTARAVTLLYIAAGLAAVVARLSIPFLVQLIRQRFVLSFGASLLIMSALLLTRGALSAFAGGLALSSFAFACIEITSNLYVLDHIPRQHLRRFEPARIFACAVPLTFGPWFGVYLQQRIAFAAPFAIAAVAAMLLLVLFWCLRLAELTPSSGKPPNPLRYLPRFFAQPRLRLAWGLAGARSAWWSVFYIYTPIFAVMSGLGAEAGGAIASIGTAWIFLVPLWGWVGRRYGLRPLLAAGYGTAGLMTVATAAVFHLPWVGAAALVLAGFGAEMIDGAGNLLFLRAVHPYERPEMTTVFVSYRDVAQLGPPLVCAPLLSVLALPSVFAAAGIMMLGSAALARYIPRRL